VQTPVFQGARVPQRVFAGGWWSASFSALTRDLASDRAPGLAQVVSNGSSAASSERDDRLQDAQWDNQEADAAFPAASRAPADLLSIEPRYNAFPAGSRYGSLLHDLLEWQAHNDWPAAQGGEDADNAAGAALLARLCQRLSLTPEHTALLAGWLTQLVSSNLPLAHGHQAPTAIQLKAIQAADRWPEMGFTLPVQALGSPQLDQLITQNVWPGQPRVPLQRRQLQGMLTGFMDLVLLHEGRYYVLDYKSNRLSDYNQPQLQQAMLAHRYDVQAALYLLALHRLLKSRLPDYDYDLHVGGALYLFLRGIDQPGCGLLHLCPPRAMMEALDVAFCQDNSREGTP